LPIANQVPPDVLKQHIDQVHQGSCPRCKGRGPVDVHTSHKVFSALIITRWSSKPDISCRACGVRNQVVGTVFSLILGWWGLPWGLILTPVQVIRNIVGLCKPPDPRSPSAQLEKLLKLNLAANIVRQAEVGKAA
jgi:hypothetical protein